MRICMAMNGSIPNLQWNAVCTEKLRKESAFTALPPVNEIPLCGPESYRMIRQDSQLWDDLHQGVLTTGKLNACLGFYEPLAAKRLGIGKGFVSHRALLSVYHHLLHDVYVPPTEVSTASSESSLTESEELALMQKRSKYAASRGAHSVRMSWGSAQEGATLYGLMHALPKSRVLEAGLFRLNEASLPKAWCFKKGELPPLGASPDGMLFHTEGICQGGDVVDAIVPSQEALSDPSSDNANEESIMEVLDQIEGTQKAYQIRDWGKMPPLSIEGWKKARGLGTFEIVEIKNRSPFRNSATGGYHISDSGPASSVPPLWIPQLQMEMLSADVGSALLVSRSATKGMTLIRVFRDDNFLKQMLVLIRRFYASYVRQRKFPPENMFFQRNDYQVVTTYSPYTQSQSAPRLRWESFPGMIIYSSDECCGAYTALYKRCDRCKL